MSIECACCGSHIWVTIEQIAKGDIVKRKDCSAKIQLEFNYYVKDD